MHCVISAWSFLATHNPCRSRPGSFTYDAAGSQIEPATPDGLTTWRDYELRERADHKQVVRKGPADTDPSVVANDLRCLAIGSRYV